MKKDRKIKKHRAGQCANQNSGPIIGVLLAMVGILIFLKQAGYVVLPSWSMSWPVIMIVIGIFMAITNGFKDMNWMVLIIIGGVFLTNNLFPELQLRKYILPIILVSVGFSILIWSLANKKSGSSDTEYGGLFSESIGYQHSTSPEDYIKISSILSGINKKVTSTNFKGGKISCMLGGAEIDLSKAEIQEVAVININEVWGGVKLIVPPHWQIESNLSVIMGAIDDKRRYYTPITSEPSKTLVLNGSLLMAGVEIQS
jgi:predicted membrane protein